MSNFLGRLLGNLFGSGKAWWVEIQTTLPACTYYFGPFDSEAEAQAMKGGYIEDLEQEGAQNIRSVVQHCSSPAQLTIADEGDMTLGGFNSPAWSQSS
ncbi:MAG: DUF1816 domain-containing protein [Leptolyngbyaceae cyanobacterium SM2_3_12]|nr:DUF1816 domain-containing protein [Leptolyngbyaceae cyanobacterium SM2_3_12]